MFNFPNSPTVGQKYSPTASVTYVWDGEKWGGGAMPSKNLVYTDGSAAMVAALTLSGDPVNPTDAADKSYVDRWRIPGACRLWINTNTQLLFRPFNGDTLKINGSFYKIPGPGIALNTTGVSVNGTPGSNLAANTLYYIYANVVSGAAVLGFWSSGFGHATSNTTGNEGVEIMAGNDQYSLVGMISTNASAQFADGYTLSWFNRRIKTCFGGGSNGSTSGSADFGAGTPFICWANDAPTLISHCQAGTTGSYGGVYQRIDFAGSALLLSSNCYNLPGGAPVPITLINNPILSEGGHQLAFYGSASGGGTLSIANPLHLTQVMG